MVFKFTMLSDESDDFIRVLTIDAESTFLDLHNAILDSVGFDKNAMTTFHLCSDDWEKEQEVTLVEMESTSEYDNLVMEDTVLEDLLTDERQKLMFVFDMMSERSFFMELMEILPGVHMDRAECIRAEGSVPVQTVEDVELIGTPKISIDENFYGDEDFSLDELDEEGFGDMNFDDGGLFSDDPKF